MVFLQKFQADRQGSSYLHTKSDIFTDEQFADEKNFLLQKLAGLKSSASSSGGGANANGTGVAGY